MAYNATRKVRTKDLKSLAAKVKALNDSLTSQIGDVSKVANWVDGVGDKGSLTTACRHLKNEILVVLKYTTAAQRTADTNTENIGSLSSLETSDKTSIVNAVNEVKSLADAAQSTADTAKTNAATAQSTANTAKTNAATAQSTANTAKTNAATANTNIGTLSSLTTSTKTNLVAAINELESRLDYLEVMAQGILTALNASITNIERGN